MDKVFLEAQLLKWLNYIRDGTDKHSHGQLLYSEGPYGILYDLMDETQSVVSKLKSEGQVVYVIISGAYRMNAGDIMYANTYLCLQ